MYDVTGDGLQDDDRAHHEHILQIHEIRTRDCREVIIDDEAQLPVVRKIVSKGYDTIYVTRFISDSDMRSRSRPYTRTNDDCFGISIAMSSSDSVVKQHWSTDTISTLTSTNKRSCSKSLNLRRRNYGKNVLSRRTIASTCNLTSWKDGEQITTL